MRRLRLFCVAKLIACYDCPAQRQPFLVVLSAVVSAFVGMMLAISDIMWASSKAT